MKEGWTYKKLGEVATFMSGYTPDKDNVLSHGDYPYYKVAEMNMPGNELYMRNTSFFVNSPKKVFPKDSIVFPKNGGAIYTEKKRILEYNSVIDLNTEALVPNNNVALMYLFYYLTFSKISKFDKGGGLPSLDLKKMSDSLIPIPPLSEQQAIVSRLDAVFAEIDALKANADKQLSEARALFQKALTEAMTPKDGWEKKMLGEIAAFSQGIQVDVNLQTEIYSPGKVRFLRIIDVTQGNVPPRFIDDPGEKYHLKADEIAMVRYGTVGFVCYGFEGVIANNLFKVSIRDKSKIQSNYLQYFLKSDLFQSHIRKGVGGAALPAIKFGDIKNILLGVPSLSEQQAIVSRLDALSEKVRRYEEIQRKTITECDALKQALLREIFEE